MAISWQELGNDWLVDDPQMALSWDATTDADDAQAVKAKCQQQIREYLQMQLAVNGLAVPNVSSSSDSAEPLWSGSLLSSL